MNYPTNRNRKRKYKPGLFWCSGCDCELVNESIKCKVCGHRNKKRRDKLNRKDNYENEN
jgi:rRNA maturation endonuclease Nob1